MPTFLNALFLIAFVLLASCSKPAPPAPAPTPPVTPPAAPPVEPVAEIPQEPEPIPPAGGLVCQPQFQFEGGDSSQQGTGFFTAAPDGEILGVTSAHFIDFDGAKLLSAAWLGVEDHVALASFTHSFGPPGSAGDEVTGDMRADYLIFSGADVATTHNILELDERESPRVGEKIWFPNKKSNEDWGHQVITGKVTEADAKYTLVNLDKYITLQSQSGSPIISQETGKVIGTLSRGGVDRGRTVLILCPARGILSMMSSKPEKLALSAAIGR